MTKYRIKKRRIEDGIYVAKMPCYHNDYYYEERTAYITQYEILKWNKVIYTTSSKGAATRKLNNLIKGE